MFHGDSGDGQILILISVRYLLLRVKQPGRYGESIQSRHFMAMIRAQSRALAQKLRDGLSCTDDEEKGKGQREFCPVIFRGSALPCLSVRSLP